MLIPRRVLSTLSPRTLVLARVSPRIQNRAIHTSILTASPKTLFSSEMSSQTASIISTVPLPESEAKWVGLKAISWKDPSGRERKWECAERKTRKGEVDAVAICTIIHRPSSEPHILLVSQFRPPVAASCIEMPAGLIDAGEEGLSGTNRAALRELKEETGYGAHGEGVAEDGSEVKILETSNVMVSDPGMTSANMKLCVVRIRVADDAEDPVAEPEEGEFIEKHLIPLKGLYRALQGFQKKGYEVDARLYHFAAGLELSQGGFEK